MATMSRIRSRQQLKEYCLRALGAPVLKINVDDDQLEDRIDDALQMFWQYHADGAQRIIVKHQLSSAEIAAKQFLLPENVISVLRILPINGASSFPVENLSYVMYMTDLMDYRRFNSGGLSSYVLTSSYINLIQDVFTPEKVIGFNQYKNYLTIDTDWSLLKENDYILIECYVITDPDEFQETWGNQWLREYTTAKFKWQWGTNLIKYPMMQLAGNQTINSEKIYNDAVDQIEKLEERLRNEYELPIDFFIG